MRHHTVCAGVVPAAVCAGVPRRSAASFPLTGGGGGAGVLAEAFSPSPQTPPQHSLESSQEIGLERFACDGSVGE